jgi:hypothetical protein
MGPTLWPLCEINIGDTLLSLFLFVKSYGKIWEVNQNELCWTNFTPNLNKLWLCAGYVKIGSHHRGAFKNINRNRISCTEKARQKGMSHVCPFFSRIHSGRCIDFIKKKPRRLIQRQKAIRYKRNATQFATHRPNDKDSPCTIFSQEWREGDTPGF